MNYEKSMIYKLHEYWYFLSEAHVGFLYGVSVNFLRLLWVVQCVTFLIL